MRRSICGSNTGGYLNSLVLSVLNSEEYGGFTSNFLHLLSKQCIHLSLEGTCRPSRGFGPALGELRTPEALETAGGGRYGAAAGGDQVDSTPILATRLALPLRSGVAFHPGARGLTIFLPRGHTRLGSPWQVFCVVAASER